MSKVFDIVHVQSVEGKDKPFYTNHGILLVKDDGKKSIKLNSVPVGEWNGWFSVFEKKKKEIEEEPF